MYEVGSASLNISRTDYKRSGAHAQYREQARLVVRQYQLATMQLGDGLHQGETEAASWR
jgi:hypothetical protein